MTWSWKSVNEPFAAALERSKREATEHVLLPSLGEKKLEHWQRDGVGERWSLRALYTMSSGKKPPSCVEGSGGSPWGLHEVAEKYGDDAEPGTVFISRESTHQRYDQRDDFGPAQPMYVTTRILRLGGLEVGLNAGTGVDTFNRYVYIHGTTRPHDFPENQSGGCLVLKDDPLIELYDQVGVGSLVWVQL